jgi:hypothetical protein
MSSTIWLIFAAASIVVVVVFIFIERRRRCPACGKRGCFPVVTRVEGIGDCAQMPAYDIRQCRSCLARQAECLGTKLLLPEAGWELAAKRFAGHVTDRPVRSAEHAFEVVVKDSPPSARDRK